MRLPLLGAYVRRLVFRWCLVRYVVWRSCQLAGLIRRKALSGRRKLLTIPIVVIGSILLERALRHHTHDLHRLVSWHDAKVAVLVFAVGCLVLLLWQGRRQVVVEQFTDWTGEKQQPDAHGLATLLVSEIAKLRDLYTTVDQRALPTAVQAPRPLEATIQVEDVSSLLESPAIVESKVSVGPIQVPLGAVLAIVGRAARGPRLVGGIHVEASDLVLTAQLSSNEKLRAWRVVGPLKRDKANAIEVPHSMVEELALRMFTDLALQGPVRWQATREFSEALRSIRVCLRTVANRRNHLLDAERQLIRALGEDEELSYVYYNLGVVYSELRRLAAKEHTGAANGKPPALDAQASPAAAEGAFKRQIELTPDRWEAYYALAMTYCDFDPPRLGDVLNRCDRVVELRPGAETSAKALLVKGKANCELLELKGALRDRRAATAESWAALCRSELLADDGRQRARQLAASALHDFASTYLDRPEQRKARRKNGDRPSLLDRLDKLRARWLLGRPVLLAPNDASIRFDRGRSALTLRGAIKDVDEALRIDPARPLYWAYLANRHVERALRARLTQTPLADTLYAKNSCERALALLDCSSNDPHDLEAFRLVVKAYEGLDRAYYRLGTEFKGQAAGAREQAKQVEEMRPYVETCRKLLEKWADERTVIDLAMRAEEAAAHAEQAKRAMRDRQGFAWVEAQARSALGRVLVKQEDYGWAVQQLRRAIELFESHSQFVEEIPRGELRVSFARALRDQRRPENREAFRQLRTAVAARPLRSEEREALAEAFYEMRDYEHARSSLEEALLWSPDRPILHRKIGLCHWRLSQDRQDATRRKRLLRRSVKDFQTALELSAADDLEGQLVAHYWLARLQKELGAYDHAIPYLRRATICVEAKPLVHTLLGEAYVRARGYLAGEEELESALEDSNGNHDHEDLGRYVEDVGWEAARVRAHAHTLRAFGYADRGIQLDYASAHIDRARQELTRTTRLREQKVSLAACEDVAGLIFLERGHAHPAIARFESSLALLAESETYVHFARACLYYVEEKPQDLTLWIRRGENACRCAIELDITERYSQEAKSLLEGLAAAKK